MAPSWYEKAATCRRIAERAANEVAYRGEAAEALGDYVADPDASVREVALRALSQVATPGDAALVKLVLGAVGDPADAIRVQALRALTALAPTGDLEAIAAATRVIQTRDALPAVRIAAIQALPRLVPRRDEGLLVEFLPHAGDGDASVRCAAVQALAALSPIGDESALGLLRGDADSSGGAGTRWLGSIKDPEWEVRVAATNGIAELAPRGDDDAFDTACEIVADPRPEVRVAAVNAVKALAPPCDWDAVCLLADSCLDRSHDVRRAALPALRTAAARPDGSRPYECAWQACMECWSTVPGDKALRLLALETATALVGRNDEEVVKRMCKGLEHREEDTRAAAADDIPLVVEGAAEFVVDQIVRRVADDHPPVRRHATSVLCKVVPQGDAAALRALLSKSKLPDKGIRISVIEAVRRLACRGDAAATAELTELLRDSEAPVRVAAIGALGDIAQLDDDNVITKVAFCLEDDDEAVRGAVADALPNIASPGNPTAMKCLRFCCRNKNLFAPRRENTRVAGCRAFAKFAERDSLEAIAAICKTIDPQYPAATIAALRVLPKVASSGNTAAIDGAASALSHPDQRARSVATEVLEQLADRATVPPAAASAASRFEGRWTGGTIKDRNIFWDDGDVISQLEVRGRSTIATVCVDGLGRKFPCWARLDAYGRLRWDFGADWSREPQGDSEVPCPEHPPHDDLDARTRELERKIIGVQDDSKDDDGELPSLGPEEEQGGIVRTDQKARDEAAIADAPERREGAGEDVGDVYAVAAVAAHFKSEQDAVREAAVLALPRVAGKGCRAAIDALLPMLQDEAPLARIAAVESLAAVARKGDRVAIEALKVRLEDQERVKDAETGHLRGNTVGINAAKALKKLVTRKEDLIDIASSLKFVGPTVRGF